MNILNETRFEDSRVLKFQIKCSITIFVLETVTNIIYLRNNQAAKDGGLSGR